MPHAFQMLEAFLAVSIGASVALGACAADSGAAQPAPSTSAQASSADPSVDIARELAAALDAQARARALLPFDAPDRKQWRRDPSPRPGLAVADMTAGQRPLLQRLLGTVLNDTGLRAVAGIRAEQDLLARGEEGLGADLYWLAIYGTPGEGSWAWRFGGHHVSVHAAYDAGRLLSLSPLLLGAERETEGDAWSGYEALRARDRLARELVALAEDAAPAALRIEPVASQSLEWSEPSLRPLSAESAGASLASLPERGQALVSQLAAEFTSVLRADRSQELIAGFERNRSSIRVAVRGKSAEGSAYYVRVHAPTLLIELSSSGWHMHTILRTDADFGG